MCGGGRGGNLLSDKAIIVFAAGQTELTSCSGQNYFLWFPFLPLAYVVVVVLLFYVHGKHLRSFRDGQLT